MVNKSLKLQGQGWNEGFGCVPTAAEKKNKKKTGSFDWLSAVMMTNIVSEVSVQKYTKKRRAGIGRRFACVPRETENKNGLIYLVSCVMTYAVSLLL